MDSTVVLMLIGLGFVAWLGIIGANALRSKGPEEIAPNLAPGMTDDELETRRLEKSQLTVIVFAGFLAVTTPLYYLTESNRQTGFEEQFAQESVLRGEKLVTEYACFSCHGPGGSGGVAAYTESRTGVAVNWIAPSLDDVLYRYDHDELVHWIAYGRPNTPMPAWGTVGGGPMNEAQVNDIANYLATVQVPQSTVVERVEESLGGQLTQMAGADDAMAAAIVKQQELLAEIDQAPANAPIARDLADRGHDLIAREGEGIDTDGDGVSDAIEAALNTLAVEATGAFAPGTIEPITLDPKKAESVFGVSDKTTASRFVSALEGYAFSQEITVENFDRVRQPVVDGLAALEAAAQDRRWEFDLQGVADTAFGGDLATAERTVALFNAYCARCHTSGFSAGTPFQQEAGAGGFGPALFEGRPAVQFLTDADLIDFLVKGSEADKAYGVNGIGAGRMPGFGSILSEEDLSYLAHWLRTGNLTGKGEG